MGGARVVFDEGGHARGPALALLSVSRVRVGDKDLYIVGGERLGREFLASLVLPTGMRALLYRNLDPTFQAADLIDSTGPATQADQFAAIVQKEQQEPGEQIAKINWTADAANAEVFHAMPLLGRQKELLGILLIGSSQHDVVTLQRQIMLLSVGVVAIGLLVGALLGWWGAARVTRPVRQLAEGAREVAGGNWNARVNVRGRNEIGQLAKAFNQMTEQLVDQRERLIAGRARGGVARSGAAAGARIEESALPVANDGGEFAAGEGAGLRGIRRSVSRIDGNSAGGNREPEKYRGPVQRIFEDAASGAGVGADE